MIMISIDVSTTGSDQSNRFYMNEKLIVVKTIANAQDHQLAERKIGRVQNRAWSKKTGWAG